MLSPVSYFFFFFSEFPNKAFLQKFQVPLCWTAKEDLFIPKPTKQRRVSLGSRCSGKKRMIGGKSIHNCSLGVLTTPVFPYRD